MKIINQAILGTVALLFASAIHAFAIEGLQISVQCSNVVLSWPSTNGETYVVQYRQTLNPTDSWTTLADYFPASVGTNITFFVHSNIIQYVSGGGSFNTMSSPASVSAGMLRATLLSGPLVMPTNGSGSAVPLALYPPGIDMSSFVIVDPLTGEVESGAGYTTRASSVNGGQWGVPLPLGGGLVNLETGFYRVVRDGAHIWGLTNGMVLSGEMQFPIELALDSTDEIVGVTFYDENDSPIIGASAQGAGNHWTLDWNTPMSYNGNYTIYAEIDFATNDSVVSTPITVTVSNVISFPNYFSRVFGSQMWIYAETIPNAAYEIDIYDESTNYLGSFYDYADSGGYISFLWDLTDGNGHTFDSTNFYGVFTVDTSSLSSLSKAQVKTLNANSPGFQMSSLTKKTFGSKIQGNVQPADAGSSSSANQSWAKEFSWTPNNNWVVAYASLTGDSIVDQSAKYMIAGGEGSPLEDFGVLGTLDPYGLHGNLSPGNNAQNGDVFTLHDQTTKTNLLSYLADQRYENFYFFGHGNETSISAYNGSHTLITDDAIASDLGNGFMFYFASPPQPANYHPYRFVWIDACDTAKGDFCDAFAIPAMTVSTNFFAAAGVESRAFIGFRKLTGFNPVPGGANGWQSRSTMIGEFLSAWLSNQYDLNTIVQNAKNSFGQGGYRMDSSAVIYGAYDLMYNTHTP